MTEWNASQYSQISQMQSVQADKRLAHLTLAGNERILDVGCGDGKVTARIARRVPTGSVLGVDPSREMVRFATATFGPAEYPNLRFEVADARTLPYRDEFDLVVSFNALHWVPDQRPALESIRQALKPGGQTLLQFVPQGRRACVEDVIEETRHSPRWAPYFGDFPKPFFHPTPEEYARLAKQCGLQVVRIRVEEDTWDFGTREAFAQFCSVTFVEWSRFIPETERPIFIADVLDRYRAVTADSPAEANVFKFEQMESVFRRP